MDATQPNPGWYDDPSVAGQLRYWDGARWTQRVRQDATATNANVDDDRPDPGPSEVWDDQPTTQLPRIGTAATAPTPGTQGSTPSVQPGWYSDPTGRAAQRYHDGRAWTASTRDADPIGHAADGSEKRRRRPVGALVAFGTLALVTVAVVVGVIVLTGDDPVPVSDEQAERDAGLNGEAEGDEDPTSERTEEGDDLAAADQDNPEDGDVEAEQPLDEEPTDDSSDRDVERLPVDFDGVCDALVPLDELERGTVRAWDVGCSTAPVALDQDESRWVVVVASLNGDDFTEGAALDRANALGLPGNVLWSSHYPSLNPDLWVVFDGPFPTQEAANDAAVSRDDASYPRVLSDDDGDRYCIAADGCRGERSDGSS